MKVVFLPLVMFWMGAPAEDAPRPDTDPVRRVRLTRIGTPAAEHAKTVLDLASGKTSSVAKLKYVDSVTRLGIGDLCFTESGIACLRNAKPMLFRGVYFSELPPSGTDEYSSTVHNLPIVPCRLLLRTAVRKYFEVVVLSMKRDGQNETIDLEYRPVTPVDNLAALERLSTELLLDSNYRVSSLEFWETEITDAALAHLEGLDQLRTLIINDKTITDAGLKHLESLANLRELQLYCPRVSDAGLVCLRRLTGLRGLSISSGQISDAGLVHLEDLSELTWLSLYGTKVTDKGLDHLKGLTKLEQLGWEGTEISEDAVRSLKQSLPNLTMPGEAPPGKGGGFYGMRELTGFEKRPRWWQEEPAKTDDGPPVVGTIAGRVVDAEGTPLRDAYVVLCDQATGVPIASKAIRPITDELLAGRLSTMDFLERRTDAKGQFRFEEVPAGRYRLIAQSCPSARPNDAFDKVMDRELYLRGIAEDVVVSKESSPGVVIRPLGTGVLRIEDNLTGKDGVLVAISTAPTRADPALRFVGWGGEFARHLIGGIQKLHGTLTVSGLPEGKVHVAMCGFMADDQSGWGAGTAGVKPRQTANLSVLIDSTWAGQREPPETLEPLFETVKAYGAQKFLELVLRRSRMEVSLTMNSIQDMWQSDREISRHMDREVELPTGGTATFGDVMAVMQYIRTAQLRERDGTEQ